MSRKWLIWLIVLFLLFLGWKYFRGHEGERADAQRGENPALLLDRVWVDSEPSAFTDYIHAMIALSDVPLGVFQKASAYQLNLEIFEFHRDGSKMVLRFPQTDTSKKFGFKITGCNELPPYDLCLDLNKNPWGGPKRYYGVRDAGSEAALLGELPARLRAAARAAR
ncbi:MAG TPA: hypothetical protein VML75_21895 [Kofleriaceae bacterium]|nr:hypothetical protein [Kofleriaceae bacterium]